MVTHCRHSKMAVSRHLRFYPTTNSAIRSYCYGFGRPPGLVSPGSRTSLLSAYRLPLQPLAGHVYMPLQWKEAIIRPIPKTTALKQGADFCPIYITLILERKYN